MAHKRKGQVTVSGEWAQHLRPALRRVFWKKERKAAKALARPEALPPSEGTGTMGPILEMPGAELLGPLPPELQTYVHLSIGASAGSKEPEAARALLRFLTSPAASPALKAKGLERD